MARRGAAKTARAPDAVAAASSREAAARGRGAAAPGGRAGARPAWGRLALAIALAGLAAGWWLGWPELAAPGGAVVGVFLAGSAASLGKPALDVRLRARRRRTVVGGSLGVTMTVVNTGRRRTRRRCLAVPVGASRLSVRLRTLAPGGATTIELAVPTTRRAWLRVGPVEVVRGDPLGLVARTMRCGEALELAVYPPTLAAPIELPGSIREVDGGPAGRAAEAANSFESLREYQPGEDARAIHWLSSARLGRLMARQSEDLRRSRMVLALACDGREYGGPEDFELAVAIYASIGLRQVDQSGELTAIADGAVLAGRGTSAGRLLDQAARARFDESGGLGRSLAAQATLARREAPAARLAVLVTGAQLGDDDLRRIAGSGWASALAIRCAAGAEASLKSVGRLAIATVGQPRHLPVVAARWSRP
ncbi:MAG: DUF58 domain-containing protein [Bifidobacteriaceae bacterium]|jgi:uncharacterized protein (DUF58 family)|nr:DUF58 domain-containing protein [Bifidobacteriaceae bacterium]